MLAGIIALGVQAVVLHVSGGPTFSREDLADALATRAVLVMEDPAAAFVSVSADPSGMRLVVRDERGTVVKDRIFAADTDARTTALAVVEAIREGAEKRYLAERLEMLPGRIVFPARSIWSPFQISARATMDGRPVAGARFYETVGRPDLARAYERRFARRDSIFKASIPAVLAGGALLGVVAASPHMDDTTRGGLALSGVALMVAGEACLFVVLVPENPVSRSEMRRLADDHNRTLRGTLGLPEAAGSIRLVGSF